MSNAHKTDSSQRLALRLRRRHYLNPDLPRPVRRPRGARAEASAPAGGDVRRALHEAEERHKEQLLRARAEFENFRRRTQREKEELRKTAAEGLVRSLLPVVDNFSRALQTPSNSIEGFAEGVRMIHNQFLDLLKEAGLEPIHPEGDAFDPNLHEAVAVEHTADVPDNRIVEVLQTGYLLQGKLVRPAMVKVARSA